MSPDPTDSSMPDPTSTVSTDQTTKSWWQQLKDKLMAMGALQQAGQQAPATPPAQPQGTGGYDWQKALQANPPNAPQPKAVPAHATGAITGGPPMGSYGTPQQPPPMGGGPQQPPSPATGGSVLNTVGQPPVGGPSMGGPPPMGPPPPQTMPPGGQPPMGGMGAPPMGGYGAPPNPAMGQNQMKQPQGPPMRPPGFGNYPR